MALNIKQRHADAVIKMLNLNNPVGSSGFADGDVYKVLIIDRFCRDIISPLLKVNDLRKHGVTLHLMMDADRQAIPDVPAVYYIQATEANIQRIIQDSGKALYGKLHCNFSASVSRPLLEDMAAGLLKANALQRIAKVFDQYTEFISLESALFSLGQPNCYLQLNDPTAQDRDVESAIENVVNGLFSVLATVGVVPIIRCPEKGPAEMVARQLDAKLRAHLVTQNNVFKEAAVGIAAMAGGASSGSGNMFQRPMLCIFDRNFELAVGVQHDWAYRPLVQDVLGLKLNRVTIQQTGTTSAASVLKGSKATSYELDPSDPFWREQCGAPFQRAAEEVDGMLKKWKQDKELVNKGGGDEEGEDEEDALADNTRKLTAAMNAVPEMVERKRVIDKHITIGGRLLDEIKTRSLDAFFAAEDDILTRGSTDKGQLLRLLKGSGTPLDRVRLAIVFFLGSENPSGADMEAVETTLKEQDIDLAPLHYVKQVKRLSTLTSAAANQYGGSKDDLLDWAGKLYTHSFQKVATGMKNLLAGGRQLAITRALESLMDAKPSPETDSFLLLDPRAPKGSPPSSTARAPVKEAIAFMIGGGNYMEFGSLQEWAGRQQPAKTVVYGATELVSPNEFVGQLAELGRKMGYSMPKPAA